MLLPLLVLPDGGGLASQANLLWAWLVGAMPSRWWWWRCCCCFAGLALTVNVWLALAMPEPPLAKWLAGWLTGCLFGLLACLPACLPKLYWVEENPNGVWTPEFSLVYGAERSGWILIWERRIRWNRCSQNLFCCLSFWFDKKMLKNYKIVWT